MNEQQVMRLWREILGVEVSSPSDDFFELGGQSLAMVQFLARVESEFGVSLPIEVLFAEDLTVAAAARAIQESREEEDVADLLAEVDRLPGGEIRALLGGQDRQ
ncbi:phosphopantetheine-binding protein [Acrocarpospora catenulata]|uniref:phosphopantetheine-binding protein n=1 Tax=Acrocarpospora catenulata TaxID=2836182 RepID=UPI001BDAA764|nr:phosphopantetheine-binding protein [Acrocarpospora catenulata]